MEHLIGKRFIAGVVYTTVFEIIGIQKNPMYKYDQNIIYLYKQNNEGWKVITNYQEGQRIDLAIEVKQIPRNWGGIYIDGLQPTLYELLGGK